MQLHTATAASARLCNVGKADDFHSLNEKKEQSSTFKQKKHVFFFEGLHVEVMYRLFKLITVPKHKQCGCT